MAKRPNHLELASNKKTRIDSDAIQDIKFDDDFDSESEFFDEEADNLCSQIPETVIQEANQNSQSFVIPETPPSRQVASTYSSQSSSMFVVPTSSNIISKNYTLNSTQNSIGINYNQARNQTNNQTNVTYLIPGKSHPTTKINHFDDSVQSTTQNSWYSDGKTVERDRLLGENIALKNQLEKMQRQLTEERLRTKRELENEKREKQEMQKKIDELKTVNEFDSYSLIAKQSMNQSTSNIYSQNGITHRVLNKHVHQDYESDVQSFAPAQLVKNTTTFATESNMFDTSEEDFSETDDVVPCTQPESIKQKSMGMHGEPECYRNQSTSAFLKPSRTNLNETNQNDSVFYSKACFLEAQQQQDKSRDVSHTLFNNSKSIAETDSSQVIGESLPKKMANFKIGFSYPKPTFKSYVNYKPIQLKTFCTTKHLFHLLERHHDLTKLTDLFANFNENHLSKEMFKFLFDQFDKDVLIAEFAFETFRNEVYEKLAKAWLNECIDDANASAAKEDVPLLWYIIRFLRQISREDITQTRWLKFYYFLFGFLNVYILRIDFQFFHTKCRCLQRFADAFGDFLMDFAPHFEKTAVQKHVVGQILGFIIIFNQTPMNKKYDPVRAKVHYFGMQSSRFWKNFSDIKILNMSPSEESKLSSNSC